MKASALPDLKSMPTVKCMPHGGQRDSLGTLNLLEPEVVVAAKEEIKSGISVSVNWDLNKPYNPGFNRRKTIHSFIDLSSDTNCVRNDEIHINTQSSLNSMATSTMATVLQAATTTASNMLMFRRPWTMAFTIGMTEAG
ncbi:hypothetical protein LTR78_004814 [Recurvomyces mirabilis]|uniref:Uncharacterized protein n=1 Tax=Recurvomyces mirabilis TaxID=574656 RepID=A0AAE1C2C8_9PEZI|nr:hypothetical protein LTR78_004814 [Recurvomyces mirabilis]